MNKYRAELYCNGKLLSWYETEQPFLTKSLWKIFIDEGFFWACQGCEYENMRHVITCNGREIFYIDYSTKAGVYESSRIDTRVEIVNPLYGRISPVFYRLMNVSC